MTTDKLDAATIHKWAEREYSGLPVPMYVQAARYALELSDKVEELNEAVENSIRVATQAEYNRDAVGATLTTSRRETEELRAQLQSQAAELERLRAAMTELAESRYQ